METCLESLSASRKDLEVRHNMAYVLFQSLEVLAVFTSAEAL